EKVFFNLLSNAVKFTPEGGRVDVDLRAEADAEGRPGVAVRVRDTGRGIPADELPHIFDRFHQVNGSVSQVQQGTGIGLALVKELVELHHGRIEVESEPGAGSTFVVWLPEGLDQRVPGDAPPAQAPAQVPVQETGQGAAQVARGPMVEVAVFEGDEPMSGDGAPVDVRPETALHAGGHRHRVLVVDDNPDVREYLQGCL